MDLKGDTLVQSESQLELNSLQKSAIEKITFIQIVPSKLGRAIPRDFYPLFIISSKKEMTFPWKLTVEWD